MCIPILSLMHEREHTHTIKFNDMFNVRMSIGLKQSPKLTLCNKVDKLMVTGA